jgi:hypothetical protein
VQSRRVRSPPSEGAARIVTLRYAIDGSAMSAGTWRRASAACEQVPSRHELGIHMRLLALSCLVREFSILAK